MAIKYVCCQCDLDMSFAVTSACQASPVTTATLTLKGTMVVHAHHWVTATCPNNHTCSYPCDKAGDE